MEDADKWTNLARKECTFSAVRSQGPGGQHVNKVASAVILQLDIRTSSLPENLKARLEKLKDRRITKQGVITIKAQRSRSQVKNKEDTIRRLKKLIIKALHEPKKRKPTKPTKASREKRLKEKKQRSQIKEMRKKNY